MAWCDPRHRRSTLQTARQPPAAPPPLRSSSRRTQAARSRPASKVRPACESPSRSPPAGARPPGCSSPGFSAARCCVDVARRSVADRDASLPRDRAPPSRPAHSALGGAARCAPIGQTPAPRPFAGRTPTPPGTPSHRPRRPHPRRDSDAPAVHPRRSPADPLRSASCSAH